MTHRTFGRYRWTTSDRRFRATRRVKGFMNSDVPRDTHGARLGVPSAPTEVFHRMHSPGEVGGRSSSIRAFPESKEPAIIGSVQQPKIEGPA
jgi:hypothetical protein